MLSGNMPAKEQGVVADVLAHLALAIERRRGSVHGIGFEQHFAHIVQRAVGGVANLEQLLRVAKLGQQVGDIADQLRIANADLFRVVTADQVNE